MHRFMLRLRPVIFVTWSIANDICWIQDGSTTTSSKCTDSNRVHTQLMRKYSKNKSHNHQPTSTPKTVASTPHIKIWSRTTPGNSFGLERQFSRKSPGTQDQNLGSIYKGLRKFMTNQCLWMRLQSRLFSCDCLQLYLLIIFY